MKTKLLNLVAICMIAGISNNLMAQVTASATATATIVAPITIVKTADMNFGNVAATSTAGTVVLVPAGTRTVGGGVTLPGTAGTVSAASFDVGGSGVYTYAITLPSSALTITNGASDTMTVSAFTSTPSGTGALSAGAQTLLVGATLNVSSSQPAGIYVSGTPFDVTVNYN